MLNYLRHNQRSALHTVGLIAFVLGVALSGIGLAKANIVAAASDLKFALDEIHTQFQAERRQSVKLVYGSSGLLYQQIVNGAPFEMLLSADEQYPTQLHQLGRTLNAGELYAIGRIVLLQKRDNAIPLAVNKNDLINAIQKAKKIAIANPQHAPYGRAAKEFLQSMGVWSLAEPKLVYGENITQATSFVLAGGADFGISALSLAQAPVISKQTRYTLISEEHHGALKQRMVLTKEASPVVMHFYDYLRTPIARDILNRYGFILPKQQ